MAAAEIGNCPGLMLPAGPLLVTSEKLEAPALALVVAQTRPPAGDETSPPAGPGPLVVAYTTREPFASLGPPAAIERTTFTSPPEQVPEPSVSKFGLSTE